MLANLEKKLDKVLLTMGVVHVHGLLDKNKKYWFIRIFFAGIDEVDMRTKILLAKSVGDVGIDNHLYPKHWLVSQFDGLLPAEELRRPGQYH